MLVALYALTHLLNLLVHLCSFRVLALLPHTIRQMLSRTQRLCMLWAMHPLAHRQDLPLHFFRLCMLAVVKQTGGKIVCGFEPLVVILCAITDYLAPPLRKRHARYAAVVFPALGAPRPKAGAHF